MNQDELKALLQRLSPESQDFTVIFSGKMSKKIDGLYHPEKQEIIIHNKNFTEDNQVIYTGIHELAHHIQFAKAESDGGVVGSRSHTVLFWDIFHKLLEKAENEGLYQNIFKTDIRFFNLTNKIKKEFIHTNGRLLKDFGKILIEALDLCQQNHANFEDYVDRELGINRSSAKAMMKVYAMDINPEIGFDSMKVVSRIADHQKRSEAEKSLIDGASIDSVKQEMKDEPKSEPVGKLLNMKKRIEKTIHDLQQKLAEVEMKIEEAGE
jgi:hypothetical protein